MNPKQIKAMLRSPAAQMRFAVTGQLPRGQRPASPLIDLLRAIPPRHLAAILGVVVDPRLGYAGRRTFFNARLALDWACPSAEMFEPWPARSWQLAQFTHRLHLQDLLACSTSWPQHIERDCAHLMRTALPTPVSRVHSGEERNVRSTDTPPRAR